MACKEVPDSTVHDTGIGAVVGLRSGSVETIARRRARTQPCRWCGRDVDDAGLGRRRQYCRQSCRQRAYEHRNAVSRGRVPPDAVVLSAEEATDLSDRLYQMRCAAEDVATAVAERAKPVELAGLVGTLLTAARSADRLR